MSQRSCLHIRATSVIRVLIVLLFAAACTGDPVRGEPELRPAGPAYDGGFIGADNRTGTDSTGGGSNGPLSQEPDSVDVSVFK